METYQYSISDRIIGGFFTYRADGNNELIFVSKGVISMFGCADLDELKELTGNSFRGMVYPEDLEQVESGVRRQIEHQNDGMDYADYRIVRKDGKIRYVEDFGNFVYDEVNGPMYYVYLYDVTDRFEKSNGTLLFDGPEDRNILMDVFATTVHEYEEIYYVDFQNDFFQMLYPDYQRGKELGRYSGMIDRHFMKGKIDNDKEGDIKAFLLAGNVKKALREKDMIEMRYRRKKESGIYEWYVTTFLARERVDGELKSAVLTIRNIEDLVQNEIMLKEALAQAQYANKSKTIFLSNMSHDIRTPMNAIIGFASLAENNIDNKERVMEYLKKIQASSNHLLNLINDVLDMSHIEKGRVTIQEKACSLSERIHSMIHMILPLIRAKQLAFSVEAEDVADEDIYTDPLKIEQAFINILSNAIKFTDPKGSISVVFRQKPCPRKGYGSYEFVVEDTGIGMSKGFLEHIYEPFERENTTTVSGQQGTGLGMTITKSIIDMLNGTIEAESAVGKGSRFVVNLTFRLQSREAPEQNELRGCHVLVVHDGSGAPAGLIHMLERLGVRGEAARSGEEAAAHIKRAYGAGDAYEAFIIDCRTPQENGIEAVRSIRCAEKGGTPVILLTPCGGTDMESEAREAGVSRFCSRPLFLSDLREALMNVRNVRRGEVFTEEEEALDFTGSRILVVDDNELNREITTEFLKDAGVRVDTAADGTIAVDMVRESEEGYYDAILMDIQMPVMNGYEATKQIRALPRQDAADLPIIALSANAFEEDRELAVKSGMNDYLAKPLNEKELFRVLKNILCAE